MPLTIITVPLSLVANAYGFFIFVAALGLCFAFGFSFWQDRVYETWLAIISLTALIRLSQNMVKARQRRTKVRKQLDESISISILKLLKGISYFLLTFLLTGGVINLFYEYPTELFTALGFLILASIVYDYLKPFLASRS